MPSMIRTCAICGEQNRYADGWFLLAENRWLDRLKVLRWDERLALQPGVLCACSPAHVQEMVAHWMATGSLDYPFALPAIPRSTAPRGADLPCPSEDEADLSGATPIGELAVHRESLRRVLAENPYSLVPILDALASALQRNQPGSLPPPPQPEEAEWLVLAGSEV